MQLKKIIALFCLMVVCIQVLPVKELGAILFNNQITEEIAHANCEKKPSIEKHTDDYLLSNINTTTFNLDCTNNHGMHAHVALVQLHVAEVQTPPPNLV